MTKEEQREYRKKYLRTPMGRAANLVSAYNENDKKYNRGKGDLTARWIVENIFSQPCAHCGKTGWEVIGCNRIDNDKPHSKDNVEPCCEECNIKYGKIKIYQYTIDGNLINTYNSIQELIANGFCISNVYRCLRGEYKQHKGFIWRKKPL